MYKDKESNKMGLGELSSFGKIVWEDRYALKDKEGNLVEKNILETFKRVSKAIASKEKDPQFWGNKFYDVMANFLFCPAGRILAHSGTHYSQLLNCFVLPFLDDSLEEIMNTVKNMAIVQKYGGGCIGRESLILTDKGPMSLEQIVTEKDETLSVLSYNQETKDSEYKQILDWHTTSLPGNRVYEIKFCEKYGIKAKMRASDWHPFFVFDGEKIIQVRADELKSGMTVIGISNPGIASEIETKYGYVGSSEGLIYLSPWWVDRLRELEKGETWNLDYLRKEYNNQEKFGKISRDLAFDILLYCEETKLAQAVFSSQIIESSLPTGIPETLYDLTILDNQTYFASDPNVGAFVVVHNTGFNFSRLRPSGSYIKGVNGRSSGIIGFINMMNTASEVIEQGGCFIADTYVATVKGPIKIKDLKKGDYVYSMSKQGNGYVLRPCNSGAWLTKKSAEVWKIRTDKGLVIYSTKDHPFMPQTGFDFNKKNYIKAQNLKDSTLMPFANKVVNDIDEGKEYVFAEGFIRASSEFSHYEDVWNVEIQDSHNFVVCDETMSTGVVVSNTRRGASLGLLEVWHPDIWEYISYKTRHNWECLREFIDVQDEDKWVAFKYENQYKWQMFNVSVGITNEFLEAVKDNKEWILKWKEEEWQLYTVLFKKYLSEGNYEEKRIDVIANGDKTAIWKVKKIIPYPTAQDLFEIVSKRRVCASEIWDRICYNAWADGCPGIINLSTARRMHNLEYISPIEATNPCLHGDTMVAVADGRNAVSIRQLAEEGKDVPVYCRDDGGKVTIRMMRHPRITGYNQKMIKVIVEGNYELRVTEEHKFVLSSGKIKRAKDLEYGDSFSIMNKLEAPFETVCKHSNSRSQNYYWVNTTDKKSWIPDHRLIYCFYNPGKLEGKIIYHKDGKGLNNFKDNLESLFKSEHDELHATDMLGDKNPMRRAQTEWSEEKWLQYRDNMSDSISGEKNGRYLGISNEELFTVAVDLTKKYDRRLTTSEWEEFALKNGYPSQFSKFRVKEFGTVSDFLDKAAIEAKVFGVGLKYALRDSFKKYLKIKDESDLDLFFDEGIKVRKICEGCGKEFIVKYGRREQCYCDIHCSASSSTLTEEGREKIREARENVRKDKRVQQIEVYNDLKFKLSRDPMKKEWVAVCKSKDILYRLPTKREIAEKGHIGTFCGFNELKKAALLHNHRVIKIEEDESATAYNGTVDEFHNFYTGHFKDTFKKHYKYFYINNLQCGEQAISKFSSCNLSSIILPNFVDESKKAVDYGKLLDVIKTAVRFSDNVIDNCEFPLPEIKEKACEERRIGVGTMGVHDMLIKLGLGYDSEEGRNVVEKVLEFIRNEVYCASIEIAKEKGSFPFYIKEEYLKSGYIETLPRYIVKKIEKYGIRNGVLLSQAPTGSISALINVSSGCEPWFSLVFQRRTRLGSYEDGCVAYIEWLKNNLKLPKPSFFKTAQEISPEDHVKMLILFSKYIDSAVSKTTNLPSTATVDTVKETFRYAMDNGVKGLTVFREGSKEGVFINKDKKEEVKMKFIPVEKDDCFENVTSPKKRGEKTVGSTYRIHMQSHNLYITVNRNKDGELVELFTTVGENKVHSSRHTSGVEDSWAEGLGKIISLALRAGVRPSSIIRNLKNIPSDKPVFTSIGDNDSSEHVPSPPHAIARVIEEELIEKEKNHLDNKCCVDCGSKNIKMKSPTCYECVDCGYSACS